MLCEDRHTGRTLSDDRTHAATSQGIPRPSGPHQKQVEAGKDFTQSLRGSMAPLSPSLWTSRFQNRERINFCHVEAHVWRQIEPVKGGGEGAQLGKQREKPGSYAGPVEPAQFGGELPPHSVTDVGNPREAIAGVRWFFTEADPDGADRKA